MLMNGTDINVGTKGVKMMFIVTWIDGECMNTRVYSKREYAERLVKWCKKHNLDYRFAEETIDREILD